MQDIQVVQDFTHKIQVSSDITSTSFLLFRCVFVLCLTSFPTANSISQGIITICTSLFSTLYFFFIYLWDKEKLIEDFTAWLHEAKPCAHRSARNSCFVNFCWVSGLYRNNGKPFMCRTADTVCSRLSVPIKNRFFLLFVLYCYGNRGSLIEHCGFCLWTGYFFSKRGEKSASLLKIIQYLSSLICGTVAEYESENA